MTPDAERDDESDPTVGMEDFVIADPEHDLPRWLAAHPWPDTPIDGMSDEDMLDHVAEAWGGASNGWNMLWFGFARDPVTLAEYVEAIEPLEDPAGTVLEVLEGRVTAEALVAASRLARRIRDVG